MNPSINALLGPLEAATRQGSWEDAEDIAGEIRRLARLARLTELQKIQEALDTKKSLPALSMVETKLKAAPRPHSARNSIYPDDWPKCPGCGGPALDGHITCGLVTCRAAIWR